jgi:hypothetical protein
MAVVQAWRAGWHGAGLAVGTIRAADSQQRTGVRGRDSDAAATVSAIRV